MYINIHRCRNCLSVIKSQYPAFLNLISSLSLVSATENPSNTSLHLMYRVLVAAMAPPANTYSYFSYLWCFGEDRMLPTLIDKCVSQYHSVQCPPHTRHQPLLSSLWSRPWSLFLLPAECQRKKMFCKWMFELNDSQMTSILRSSGWCTDKVVFHSN